MTAERAAPPPSWWTRTRQDMVLLLRVHRLLLRDDWTRGRILIAILCLQAAIPIAQLWLTRAIVNALVASNGDAAIGYGAATVVAVLAFQIVTPIQMVLASQIQDTGVAQIEREMIRAGSKLRDLTAIGNAGYLDRMNAIRDGAMEFGMAISRAGRFYAGAISLIGILISLVALQPVMPILLMATGYLAHRFSRRLADLQYASLWAVARSGAEMHYAQHVATRAASAAEVRMFGLGPWLRARYLRFAGETLAELGAKRRSGALWAIAGTTLHVIALAGSFWYVAWRAEGGTLSVGDLALFINALIQAQFLTQDLFVSVQTLRRITLRARDFFPFIDEAAPGIALPPDGEGLVPTLSHTTLSFRLKHSEMEKSPCEAHPAPPDAGTNAPCASPPGDDKRRVYGPPNGSGSTYVRLDEPRGQSLRVTGQHCGRVPTAEPHSGITLRDVSFCYPDSERAVLTDLSLDLPAGTVTALVGENGVGKSTLVGLLSRMFDPTSGTVALDGIPYPMYDLTALRERMTVVFQDGSRFAFSLAENIAIGDPGFTWADPEPGLARARAVGDRVGIGTIADGLPRGYATGLTGLFDDTTDLSGGQWQLVTFARGLIRDDAALAMLDEPSSALDSIREREQIDHLRNFARAERRSVLLISHRLSTVRWADRIAVLAGGRIVESGTHDDLVSRGGVYADLFRMQASRYQDQSGG